MPTDTANNWLSSDVYDPNGNTRTNGANVFLYDAENRLTNAVVGGTTIALAYNGDGTRVRKTISGTTTLYLVDDRNPTGYVQVLEEKTVSGGVTNLSKVFAYGLDLIAQRNVTAGETLYLSADGLGSTRLLTTTNATIANAFAYEAFGTLIASNTTAQTDYLFTGEQHDPNLGFTYLRARYHNSGTGRFLTRDTYAGMMQDPPTLHRYLYARNNPVNYVDPSGEFSVSESLLVTSIQGGLRTKSGQAVLLGLVVVGTYAATRALLEEEVSYPHLKSAVSFMQAAIHDNRAKILGYARDRDLEYDSPESIPPFQKVKQSAGGNLLGININTTITGKTKVSTRWLQSERPSEVELKSLLAHEYGHILYNHLSAFLPGNEAEANHFQAWFSLEVLGLNVGFD